MVWPLVAVGTALTALATLTTLAIENPSSAASLPNPLPGVSGACLGLVNLFLDQGNGDPLDASDVPLLVVAGVAAIAGVVAFWGAKSRR